MPKRNTYKMRKDTEARLRKEIRNFNQRRDRFIRSHPDLAAIQPPRIKPGKALKELGSTADVKAFEKMLKSYTAKTARPADTGEGGVKITKWELDKVRRDVKRINAKKAAQKAKERKVYINGQEVINAKKMGKKLEDEKPVKINLKTSNDQWKKLVDYFELTAKDYYTKIKVPSEHFAKLQSTYFSKGPGDPILWGLYETIPKERLLDMYYQDYESTEPDWVYDGDIDNDDKVIVIKEELGAEIKNDGLVDQALDNMAKASGYDSPELRELWDQIGHEEIFDQYLENENIFDIDYLYELADNNEDSDEEEND